MTTTLTEDLQIEECAANIARHLERNMARYEGVPEIYHRMEAMNEYIHTFYLKKEH